MDVLIAPILESASIIEERLGLPHYVAIGVMITSLIVAVALPLALLWLPSTVEVGNVTRIFVYPVKGCQGLEVREWPMSRTGLLFDRSWMIVNTEDGGFVSMRNTSVLAGIRAEPVWVGDDHGSSRKPWDANALRLSAPKCGEVVAPILNSDSGARRSTTLFRTTVSGIDQGDEVAEWLTKTVHTLGGDLVADGSSAKPTGVEGKQLRLIHVLSEDGAEQETVGRKRVLDDTYAVTGYRRNLSFSDCMPVMVANESNCHELSKRMQGRRKGAKVGEPLPLPVAEDPIDMRRFRPNIVLNHGVPFAEDYWLRLQLRCAASSSSSSALLQLRRTKRCTRCSVPTVDPVTWQRAGVSEEPISTMRRFRQHPTKRGQTCFGSYFVPADDSEGLIVSVGDAATVLEMDFRDY